VYREILSSNWFLLIQITSEQFLAELSLNIWASFLRNQMELIFPGTLDFSGKACDLNKPELSICILDEIT
jgi:hypothetical protein